MTSCWIVTEGIAGTENQCLGVAEALGVMPVVKRIGLNPPWNWLLPRLPLETAASFSGDALAPPWPDLLITSGRKAVAAARYVKNRSDGKTIAVHIQDPRAAYECFDLIAVPQHDRPRGDNILVTAAAPNRITPLRLVDARDEFAPRLSPLPAPRVAVLLGGASRAYRITPDFIARTGEQLLDLAAQGFGLMVTASRRTGAANVETLRRALAHPNIFFWDGTGDNPYFGFLAWADYILVTADSVSMIAEAATTGRPVYILGLDGGSRKFDRFHDFLAQRGVTRPFAGTLENYDYSPLDDAGQVAAAIKKRLYP